MPSAQTDVQWDQMTIPGTLARAASLWPNVSALEDGAKKFTFAELAGAVENASRAFIAAGIERGDRVAIWAPNGWRWEVAALGLQLRAARALRRWIGLAACPSVGAAAAKGY